MADAVHCLVQIQLSFAAPYISMGRLYTTGTHKRALLMHYAGLRQLQMLYNMLQSEECL